jgi:alkylhydroperoxidase family enzyme
MSLDTTCTTTRLSLLDQGLSWPAKFFMSAVCPVIFRAPRDEFRPHLYRPGFTGFRLMRATLAACDTTFHSTADLLLFGAFTSYQNKCQYCTGIVGAAASVACGEDLVNAVFDDWHTAPVTDATRSILSLLEKLAHSPDQVDVDDIESARAFGFSDGAIKSATAISSILHIINRVNDALGVYVPWEMMNEAERRAAGSAEVRVFRWADKLLRGDFEVLCQRVVQQVLVAPGHLDTEIRKPAFEGSPVPAELQNYVNKIRNNAYKIVDQDIYALVDAGYSEDQIYELTVATAIGSGLSRYNIVTAAMQTPRTSRQSTSLIAEQQ